MIKIVTFFIFLTQISLYAQEYEYKGAIMLGNSEALAYVIYFNIDRNNHIQGYSVSDYGGINETEAEIKGDFIPNKKLLTFTETKILFTKSKVPEDQFCLMKVNGKLEKKFGKEFYQGNFSSHNSDTAIQCVGGTMILASPKTIQALAKKALKVIDKIEMPDSIRNEAKAALNNNVNPEPIHRLESGDIQKINWPYDTLRLEIWDDKIEDGDIVEMELNGKKVISNYSVTNKVRKLQFKLISNQENKLTIRAITEGKYPPNSAKINIIDPYSKRTLICTNLKIGQTASILLKK